MDQSIKKIWYSEDNINIDEEDDVGQTPLHIACYEDHIDYAKYLILKGANLNKKDRCGQTPLHYASLKNNLECVKYLILNGADVNVDDHDGKTAFEYLEEEYKIEITKYLEDLDILNIKEPSDEYT